MLEYNGNLSRSFLRDFGIGRIPITSSTFDLLTAVSPYVDLDGKINIDLEFIRKDNFQHHSTFKKALECALSNSLLVEEYDYATKRTEYFSMVHKNGNDNNISYVPLLAVFESSTFRNYNITLKRLFSYFVSLGDIEVSKEFLLCNLFRNSISLNEVFFKNIKETLTALLGLSLDELIKFNLFYKSQKECFHFDSNSVANYLLDDALEKVYDSLQIKKNERVKMFQLQNLHLEIIFTEDVRKSVVPNQATIYEINRAIVDYCNLPPFAISEESKQKIISKKLHLYFDSGNHGLKVYRTALRKCLIETDILIYDSDPEKRSMIDRIFSVIISELF